MTALEKFFAKHPYVLMALIIVLLCNIDNFVCEYGRKNTYDRRSGIR